MAGDSHNIVQKLWNYCNVLRDDGMSYGDYVEQLTYLLFLKMADERTKPPYAEPSAVPTEYGWPTLIKKDGDELFDHYRHVLEKLGNEKGLLGLIFNKSQNKFQGKLKASGVFSLCELNETKVSRILKHLRAELESIYGRRFTNQSTSLDLMRLAKEALPNAMPLTPEERVFYQ